MTQQVRELKISDLVLWTENPRDPIDPHATDQNIVDKALDDINSKWSLSKLSKEMGAYYDFSELPTVVFKESKPIVYDGNRRMILAKIKHNLVDAGDYPKDSIPDIPFKISCNVCTEDVALNNVLRKHGDSGTWSALDRDIFLHRFMNKEKSTFLKLDENTGIISSNNHLNKTFVKNEVLSKDRLDELGFSFDNDKLLSSHNKKEAGSILEDISFNVLSKNISTRKNRGQVLSILKPGSKDLVDKNASQDRKPLTLKVETADSKKVSNRLTKRTKKGNSGFFGKKLILVHGNTSNLYRDVLDLFDFYIERKNSLSDSFPGMIRMSLRLLCESAANDKGLKMDKYIFKHYKEGRKLLDSDMLTTLSSQNVKDSSIIQLLHIGAHNYSAANNMEQTMAMSLIIGAILTTSHGKNE